MYYFLTLGVSQGMQIIKSDTTEKPKVGPGFFQGSLGHQIVKVRTSIDDEYAPISNKNNHDMIIQNHAYIFKLKIYLK